jgi:hypothetical protein
MTRKSCIRRIKIGIVLLLASAVLFLFGLHERSHLLFNFGTLGIFVSWVFGVFLGLWPLAANYLFDHTKMQTGALAFFLFEEKSDLDVALKNASKFKR